MRPPLECEGFLWRRNEIVSKTKRQGDFLMLRGTARKAVAYGTLIVTLIMIIGVIAGMNELGAVKASNL